MRYNVVNLFSECTNFSDKLDKDEQIVKGFKVDKIYIYWEKVNQNIENK